MQEPDTDKDLHRTSLKSVDPVAGRTASLRHYPAYLNWSENNGKKLKRAWSHGLIKVPVAWSFAQLLKWHWQRLYCSRQIAKRSLDPTSITILSPESESGLHIWSSLVSSRAPRSRVGRKSLQTNRVLVRLDSFSHILKRVLVPSKVIYGQAYFGRWIREGARVYPPCGLRTAHNARM